MSDTIIASRDGPALILRINRPDDLNRFDTESMLAMNAELDRADTDESVRVIVITGNDKAFCSGGRIDGHPDGTVMQQVGFGRAFCGLQDRMAKTRAPIVAAVEGQCVAGGMSILAACDLAVASSTAEFAFPEIDYGLFPILAMGVEHSILPAKAAFDLFYTGRRISAQEAQRLYLVNDVAEPADFWKAVNKRVEQLASKSATALALGRKGYYAMAPMVPSARVDYAQTLLPVLLAAAKGALVPR